jgi:hypothetical protein
MGTKRWIVSALGLALVAGVAVAVTSGKPVGGAPACTVFPADNPWNQRVDHLPVASRSAAYVKSMGASDKLFADFSIPYTTVGKDQRKVPISFFYRRESDRGPYPIPPNAPIEEGEDKHVIVVDRDACRLYEVYKARRLQGGRRWKAGAGAIWSLRSNKLRPAEWTSADGAGLPILPGLARFDEYQQGEIDHAIRFTADNPRDDYVYPARHSDGDSESPRLPPMGARVRLKASFDVSGFPPQARVILRALQRYGMILADTGAPWFISGAPSDGWDDGQLETLHRVKGRHFEAVDTRSLPQPR